jgi:hypothetical protein
MNEKSANTTVVQKDLVLGSRIVLYCTVITTPMALFILYSIRNRSMYCIIYFHMAAIYFNLLRLK